MQYSFLVFPNSGFGLSCIERHMKNLASLIESIIRRNLDSDSWEWLLARAAAVREDSTGTSLNLTFTAIPRKTGKKDPAVTADEQQEIDRLLPGFYIQDWAVDRLSRVWLLMQADPTSTDSTGTDLTSPDPASRNAYIKKIENLFAAAEMSELVALYSALPILAYPEEWRKRCAEGIRSNIATVLEAIIHRNPYPAAWLDEPAWNQLVVKAFFTDKEISLITGLEQRANRNLANILADYARERQAAGRPVNPQLWELLKKSF